MFRRATRLLRYHQEVFGARMEAFLVQVMRGLKVEKRWEMGMGHGIFARESVRQGDLIMFDLPFLSMDFEQIPEAMREALRDFDTENKIQQILNQTAQEVAFESRQDPELVRRYLVANEMDVDMVWMALIACWGVAWCNHTAPVKTIPFAYFSYIDEYYKDKPMDQDMMNICYNVILDVVGIDPELFTKEDFWVSLFKVKSNVFRGHLYPVAPTLVNHSCWPNARFADDGALIALRDIPADEQVCVAMYGENCDEVRDKGLGGEKFKCMTPGCEWSKRVPLPGQKEVDADDERLYITPWHRMEVGGPLGGLDVPDEEAWQSPAKAKFREMWANEVTRAGRDLGNTPQLPGSRPRRFRIAENADPNGLLVEQLNTPGGRDLIPNPTRPQDSRDHL